MFFQGSKLHFWLRFKWPQIDVLDFGVKWPSICAPLKHFTLNICVWCCCPVYMMIMVMIMFIDTGLSEYQKEFVLASARNRWLDQWKVWTTHWFHRQIVACGWIQFQATGWGMGCVGERWRPQKVNVGVQESQADMILITFRKLRCFGS